MGSGVSALHLAQRPAHARLVERLERSHALRSQAEGGWDEARLERFLGAATPALLIFDQVRAMSVRLSTAFS